MTAEEIARGLTLPQREAMLWLPANGQPRLKLNWEGATPRWDVLLRLRRLGLCVQWLPCPNDQHSKLQAYSASFDLGLAVRHHLTGTPPRG